MWTYEHVRMYGALMLCNHFTAEAVCKSMGLTMYYSDKHLPCTMAGAPGGPDAKFFVPFVKETVTQKHGSHRLGLPPVGLSIFDKLCDPKELKHPDLDSFFLPDEAEGVPARYMSVEVGMIHFTNDDE